MTTLAAAIPRPRKPRPARRVALPWYLVLPAVLCGLGVAGPMVYLVIRALSVEPAELSRTLLDVRNLRLLGSTLLLCAGVLVVTTAMALPAAWLTARTDLPLRRFFALAMVLPLAVPGYLTAFSLLSLGGYMGAVAQVSDAWFGQRLVMMPIRGYLGALIALSLYNFPYMMLNLRAAFLSLDPTMGEVGRSLGRSPAQVFVRVVLPQLRPALLAGGLLVCLHVVADFGVVHLMGYPTFSYALYEQYAASDITGMAWYGLMMIALAGLFIALELWLLRGLRLHRAGSGVARGRPVTRLRGWAWPAMALLLLIFAAGVLLPAGTTGFWLFEPTFDSTANLRDKLFDALRDSVLASLAAAAVAVLLALPVALLAARYPGKRSVMLERVAYMGYATPALAFALGLLVLSITIDRLFVEAGQRLFYGSFAVLIYGYALHFMAEGVGPIRAALFHATPRLEEASRGLGRGFVRTSLSVTLPLLRPGLMVSLALVFLSTMKELPLTMLLRPYDFTNLAYELWSRTDERLFADAAPFALGILVVSIVFVGALLLGEARLEKRA